VSYLIIAVLAAAVAVFAMQNSMPADVEFLFWRVPGVPVSAVILMSLAIGVIVAGVPLLLQRWRLQARIRNLENRIVNLENALRRPGTPGSTAVGS
jgi:uncharacterized integral membrane protein